MTNTPFQPHTDRFVRGLLRRIVDRIIARSGLQESDRADLEHQLLLKLIQAMKAFDPAIGHIYPFVTVVVERHAANILRDHHAIKRDGHSTCSLSIVISTGDGPPTELASLIGEHEHAENLGRRRRSVQEQAALFMDVEATIASLPEPHRDLVRRLMSESISQIARDTGTPRTTLQSRMTRVRRRFEDAGLKDYL